MAAAGPHDLDRFVNAQAPVIDAVLAELRAGRKRSHWMWFVFPQLRGLGASAMADRYGLASADEARAYLAHPLLGPRLRECCALVLAVQGAAIDRILGYPDNLKFRSCLTLFDAVAPQEAVFRQCLDKYYGGRADPKTVAMLRGDGKT